MLRRLIRGVPRHFAPTSFLGIAIVCCVQTAGNASELVVLVDANRDGKVTRELDESGSSQATLSNGGLVICNCDDDDQDGERDCDDTKINGTQDKADLAVVRVLLPELGEGEPGRVIQQLSMQLTCPGGSARLFGPDGVVSKDDKWTSDTLQSSNLTFHVEATRIAGADWAGDISLKAVATTTAGDTISATASLQVAPLILRPGSAPPKTVVVREYPGRNDAFIKGLEEAVGIAGCELKVIAADASYPAHHIWLQDAVEFGESSTPTSQITIALPSNRNRDIDLFARDHLMGPGLGYVRVGTYRKAFAEGEGGTSWIDWYGNLEATPAVPGHPLGRILYGVDRQRKAQLNPKVISMLESQQIQQPLPLDVGWLVIKHVDEMVNFVADPNDSTKFWTLVPDTNAAIALLSELQQNGHGEAPLLDVYEPGLTVDQLLADDGFIATNRQLQTERIDPMIESLQRGLKLESNRILRIPSLYKEGGLARVPSMVNCLVLGKHLVIADPNGPIIQGEDAFQTAVRKLLSPLGLSLHFVDDRQYHKWSGNVHCATNAVRTPLEEPWWIDSDSEEKQNDN